MSGSELTGRSAEQPAIAKIIYPFQRFFRAEASSGVLLIACIVAAMIWANSQWADTYIATWQTEFTVGIGSLQLSKPILLWINDGLMAIFFLVIGLEIKRELLVGELAQLRRALLPVAAALGGMIVPAAIYLLITAGTSGARGWGIPMATDIALSLGVLSLLPGRATLPLRVFLTAVAIVDDIGAVVVIGLFYTQEIVLTSLGLAVGIVILLLIANRWGVRHVLIYSLLGVALWLAVLSSGLHATLAGVLLAMTIPSRTVINPDEFVTKGETYMSEFRRYSVHGKSILSNREQRAAVQSLELACREVASPLQRIEHGLHPWVAFGIVPLFALANGGVRLAGNPLQLLSHPVALGVIAGLVLGKQLGIFVFSWAVIRTGLVSLPAKVNWVQVYAAGWLAGIGFTMSIFIATLAFESGELLQAAKAGILFASVVAGMVGWIILRRSPLANADA
jgi:NhaA family Na+:H+ antiporter